MKRYAAVVACLAVVATALGVAPAGAAPGNKNVTSVDAVCGAPVGATQVSFVAQSSGAAAFFGNGMVGVLKTESFVGSATFAVDGGPSFELPDQFSAGGKGKGYQGKLITCVAEIAFEDAFTLTSRDAADLGAAAGIDLTPFIGSTVNVSGSGTFTAGVLLPGA